MLKPRQIRTLETWGMPNSKQIRYYWLKWIDRQYLKADPSHVKMHPEIPKPSEEISDGAGAEPLKQEGTNKIPPTKNGSERG